MSDQITNNHSPTLEALAESILFVASGPISVNRLANALDVTPAATRKALARLEEQYRTRGLRLQWLGTEVQLTTAPEASAVIERFLGLETPVSRLSPAALEVLAIIAYMQPITRPQIDEIRGVNSDGALRTLLNKGMLEEIGRLEGPGRPILYGTTPEFMQHFGLTHLSELPELRETPVTDLETE